MIGVSMTRMKTKVRKMLNDGIIYAEARITFPNKKTRVLNFTGDKKFIMNQLTFYHLNGCQIKMRERWFK